MKDEKKGVTATDFAMPRQSQYKSKWQTQLDDTMGKIMNREKFTYDLNGDALWNQYKDQYVTGGKMAMMDTMGQAAALTGGYGNSYAQGVGQQAYQGYIQGLNDKIPELYQMALDSYNREGDALMQQYGLLADRESTDYGRYTDQRNYDYQVSQDQADRAYRDQMDAREMAMAMMEAGTMPSEQMLAAAGLTGEFVTALYPDLGAGGANGSNGEIGINMDTRWWEETVNEGENGWLTTTDGKKWQRSTQGQNWVYSTPYALAAEYLDAGSTMADVASVLAQMGLSQYSIDAIERKHNESKSGE